MTNKNNDDDSQCFVHITQASIDKYNAQQTPKITITSEPTEEQIKDIEEWFFRWIARGKAGFCGMSMEQCADMIWHHPSNPYFDNNPWEEKDKT